MNGFELQERLENQATSCQYFMTHTAISRPASFIKAGAEDFVSKPVANEALFECVERALGRNLEQSTAGLDHA